MTTEKENKTKILINIYKPLIAILKYKLDSACLKRDAYLDKILRVEAICLKSEITTPNSDMAKNFITKNLKQLPLKPLNLLISTETVDLINSVCKEKNVPRDTFINRVLMLLIASDPLLHVLFFQVIRKSFYQNNLSEAENLSSWESSCREMISAALSYGDNSPRLNLNHLDNIEGFVTFTPSEIVRHVFIDEPGWTNFYSYAFEKDALQKLPKEYDYLKTDNILGFNTFMTDNDVKDKETLNHAINKTIELDKLLAFTKKEKSVRKQKSILEGEEK
ncbi:MAG: hypothetical protein RQ875_14560 [Vicingaceae bacterium]|nr:hypothetical protein [Vicingaceae bacterium]